jgi:PST family polysaccharide transporter
MEVQSPPEPATPPPIGKAAASGLVWTTGLSFAGRGATLLAQLVLAKILMPEDFGVLGLAYTITTLFGILTSFGIDQVFQQRQPRMHLWSTQTFVISLALSVLVAAAMAIYAPIGAKAYHNDKIVMIVWVIATSFPLAALSTVPQARLKSQLKFKFLAVYASAEVVATQLLTIVLAWAGLGAISFVLPLPVMALIKALVFWRLSPMPLRPVRRSKGWGHMIKNSASMLGITVLTTVIGQGDYIILGLTTSAQVVGVYYFAFRLVAQPMMMLAMNFTGILRPSLIAMKDDPLRQRNAALKTAELLGLVTVPVCFMQAAIARPALILLFGDRWVESIPLIQILSIGLPLDAAAWAAGALLESRGQFLRSFKYQLLTAPLFFVLVGTGAWLHQAVGVAVGVTLYYTIHPLYLTTMVFCKEGISLRRVMRCCLTPLALGLTTIGAAYALSQMPLFHDRLIVQMAVAVIPGGIGYALAVRYVVPEIYADIRNRLAHVFHARTKTVVTS